MGRTRVWPKITSDFFHPLAFWEDEYSMTILLFRQRKNRGEGEGLLARFSARPRLFQGLQQAIQRGVEIENSVLWEI